MWTTLSFRPAGIRLVHFCGLAKYSVKRNLALTSLSRGHPSTEQPTPFSNVGVMKLEMEVRNAWKSVCDTGDARLVLTSYPPGAQVRDHSHNFNLLGMLIYGEMHEKSKNQKTFTCRAFDVGLQPSRHRHSNFIGATGLRSFMILFDDAFPRRLGFDPSRLRQYSFLQDCASSKLGVCLYDKILSRKVTKDEFCFVAQTMFQSIVDQCEIDRASPPRWLTNTVQWASENGDSPQVRQLANHAKRHPDYFSRAFRKYFGETYRQFQNRKRVCDAARMLVGSAETIAHISAACGFSDQPHMTKMFRRYLGTTPNRLRNLARAKF